MKTTLFLFAGLFAAFMLRAQPSELFFSEYVEGSSYNKALEIYNGTGAAIDLTAGKYSVLMYMNGNTSVGVTINLAGTVAAGDAFVLAHSSASAAVLTTADQTASGSWFNGNDTIVLSKNGVIIDVIGQIGFDPGTEWGTGLASTADNTLRRKSTVCAGDADGSNAFVPAAEWDGFAQDTFNGLGSHTADCGSGSGITPIYDIQYTTAGSGDSPLKDQGDITTAGIVTAVFTGSYVIEDASGGAWRGLWIDDAGHTPARGDRIQATGTVRESDGLTTLAELTAFQIVSSGNPLPAPQVLATNTVSQEHWEGVLVRVENLTVSNADLGDGEWSVTDGSGDVRIDDKGSYSYTPALGATLAAIVAPVDFYGTYKLQPLDDSDIIQTAQRLVVINELLADPGSSTGDANQDGVVSTTQDEFVELLNLGSSEVDISGWTLSDKQSVRHTFPAGTVLKPEGCVVVFSGGNPSGDFGEATVQKASSGSLSLNNDDETITLHDGSAAQDAVTYGSEGSDDQSLTRDPDGTGTTFVKHTKAAHANGALFSPGRRNDGSSFFSTYIHTIQGTGTVSPLDGKSGVVVEGVVVGDFQGSSSLGGFFVQEEDHQVDGDPASSEGLFIYYSGADVSVGDRLRVTGRITEYNEKTEMAGITKLTNVGTAPLPTATTLTLPASSDEFERREGMLITVNQPLTVSGTYSLAEYGEVDLSINGRLYTPTSIVNPGVDALAQQSVNYHSRIQLDDGSSAANPSPIPYLTGEKTLRLGSTLPSLTGALDYSFSSYEIHPTSVVTFNETNGRIQAPVSVNGPLKAACLNIDNFFNGNGSGGGFPTSRGAATFAEYQRQRQKLISAITSLDAEILGLVEIENDGFTAAGALQDLVSGLNVATAPSTYAFVNPGLARVGTDEITNAILYKPAAVEAVGAMAILDHSIDSRFDEFTRPSLAQTFQDGEGDKVTLIVNHFRSKGGTCSGDPDIGDGQGACNQTRVSTAQALRDWLATDPTGSGDPDFLIMGDLNTYAKEDPVKIFTDAGYLNEVSRFLGNTAYSYVFSAQAGYLDHALVSPSLDAQITGVTIWHINADEPEELDYRSANPPSLYLDGPFRSSDHDPVIVGLNLDEPVAVELTLFEAGFQEGSVHLRWKTGSEPGLAGFNIYHSPQRDGEYVKNNAALIKNQGDSVSGSDYEYIDDAGDAISFYKIEIVSLDGRTQFVGPVGVVSTRVKDGATPACFALRANYPNPFNQQTTIQYDIPRDGFVSLIVYNLFGEKVAALKEGNHQPGSYKTHWDGLDQAGRAVSSGVYLYRLTADGVTLTGKMALIR